MKAECHGFIRAMAKSKNLFDAFKNAAVRFQMIDEHRKKLADKLSEIDAAVITEATKLSEENGWALIEGIDSVITSRKEALLGPLAENKDFVAKVSMMDAALKEHDSLYERQARKQVRRTTADVPSNSCLLNVLFR